MSLASPRTLDGTPSRLMFSEYGAVQWQKYVYYSLRPRPNHPGLGEFVRDEAALATDQPNPADVSRRIPVASAALPSQSKGTPQRRRVLFRNIVLPHQPLPGGQTLDHRGGFRAQVVGETVELELIVQSDKTLSAKTTLLRLPLAVKPGNF